MENSSGISSDPGKSVLGDNGVPKAVRLDDVLISLEQITIEQGLSQGMVNACVQDRDGFLWIATKDGLNRYDGTGFKVFRHQPSDSRSIADNFIMRLILDKDGRLWIGTQSNGLDLFNPETETFIHFQVSNSRLSSNFTGNLSLDTKGAILVQTMDGVGYNRVVKKEGANPYHVDSYSIEPVWDVFPALGDASKDDRWDKEIGFEKGGTIWYYREDRLYRILNPFESNPEIQTFPHKPRHSSKVMDDSEVFFNLDHSQVYIIDNSNTLLRFQNGSMKFEPVINLPSEYVFKCGKLIDSSNRLWLITDKEEVVRVNLGTGDYSVLQLESDRSNKGLPYNFTAVLLEDNQRNVWLGTGGHGLYKISNAACRFKRPLGSKPITDGLIYLFRSTKPGKKALFDESLYSIWLKLRETNKLDYREHVLSLNQTHLSVDAQGNFWLPASTRQSKGEQVVRINPSTGELTTVVDMKERIGTRPGSPCFADRNGNIWFSERVSSAITSGVTSLYRIEAKSGELHTYPFPIETEKFQYRFVSDWYEDVDNGYLWFATTHGLFGFDPKTEKWNSFRYNMDDSSSISSNMLLCVCPDPVRPNDILWIGTEGFGLNRFNIRTGKFDHYTTRSGLPNDVVYSIQADGHKNLWMGTNAGLCHFDPVDETFKTYTTEDGLPGNEFNRYQYSSSPDGQLYFGGTNGVVFFDPEDFYTEIEPSNVIINRVLLFNNEMPFTAGDGCNSDFCLPKPIEKCTHLTFGHQHDMITFSFALMDLTAPKKNSFKYKMHGLHDDWINGGTRNEATFTDLSPGKYTLEVSGCNSYGVWSDQSTKLDITILPPWYATWWFRTLMILLVAGMLYGLYRYRLEQLLRVERVRNRIAQDLHDEIGSTISSISLFGSVLKNTMRKDPDKADKLLDRITTYSSQIGERMNDMVWTIKADNDSFEHVVNRMRAYAVAVTESKGVKLNFAVDSKVESLSLEMEIRKNIYLIFKEAVNNSAKYSNCSELSVGMELQGNLFTLSIKDNGIGFDAEAVAADRSSFGGNGLNGMRNRAKEIKAILAIDTWPKQGTEIKLKVTL